jgi:hypothetical protein
MGSKITVADDFKYVTAVYSADLDNDGYEDIIGAGGYDPGVYAWYRNNGDSTFTEHIIGSDVNYDDAYAVTAADLDNDGNRDVIGAASWTGLIHYFLNDGSGSFGSGNLINAGICDDVYSIFAADINKDGYIDILSASYGDNEIAWWENDGNLLNGISTDDWTKHTIDGSFTNASCVYSIDIDGDGDNDVIAASKQANGEIALWLNNGTGTFGPKIPVDAAFAFPSGVYSADINGDGNLDIIAAGLGAEDNKYLDGRVAWWEGDGTGNFGTRQSLSFFRGATSVSAADFDGDGDTDICGAALDGGEIAWWSNNLTGWGK